MSNYLRTLSGVGVGGAMSGPPNRGPKPMLPNYQLRSQVWYSFTTYSAVTLNIAEAATGLQSIAAGPRASSLKKRTDVVCLYAVGLSTDAYLHVVFFSLGFSLMRVRSPCKLVSNLRQNISETVRDTT